MNLDLNFEDTQTLILARFTANMLLAPRITPAMKPTLMPLRTLTFSVINLHYRPSSNPHPNPNPNPSLEP